MAKSFEGVSACNSGVVSRGDSPMSEQRAFFEIFARDPGTTRTVKISTHKVLTTEFEFSFYNSDIFLCQYENFDHGLENFGVSGVVAGYDYVQVLGRGGDNNYYIDFEGLTIHYV